MGGFNIDPEVINQYVAEQIIASALGESLKKAIDEEVAKISKSYDNPMKRVVADHLAQAAREYLETPEVKARLRTVVEEKLTDDAVEKFISQVITEGYRR